MQVFATSCAMLLTAAASSVLLQQQIHLQLVLGMTITSIAAALFYADPGTLTGLNKASSRKFQRLFCAVEIAGRELGFCDSAPCRHAGSHFPRTTRHHQKLHA